MARFALATAVSRVIVIFKMAGYASAIHFIIERIVTMAVVADQLTVTSLEREFRISTMVKTCIVPGDSGVAVSTFVTASALVCIVVLVAGVAF
jgi:hypothetical protein